MSAQSAVSATALATLASSLQTLLGPNKALKCVVNTDGESVLTRSTLRLCQELSIQHPAALLLLEACEGLQKTHGCGTTTLICLTADLALGLVRLEAQGFSIRKALRCLSNTIQSACATLHKLVVPLPLVAPLLRAPATPTLASASSGHSVPDRPAPSPPCSPPPSPPSFHQPPEGAGSVLEGVPSSASTPCATVSNDDDDVSWFFEDEPAANPRADASMNGAASHAVPGHGVALVPEPRQPMREFADARAAQPSKRASKSAVEWKEEGNAYLRQGRLAEAVASYTAAIQQYDGSEGGQLSSAGTRIAAGGGEFRAKPASNHRSTGEAVAVCLANRSLAHARLSEPTLALHDAQRAVATAPMYAKAHHRLGSALQLLGKHDEAKGAFLLAQRLDRPSSLASPHAKLPSSSSPLPATPLEPVSFPPLPRTTRSTPTTASATTSATAATNVTATLGEPEMTSTPEAATELLVPMVASAPSQSLALLADGLSHGHALEMQLAVRCAHWLGSPPWRLPIDVAVHRLVGPSSAHSAVEPGVLLPLTAGEQRGLTEGLMLRCSATTRDGGCAASIGNVLGGVADGMHFSVCAALLDADIAAVAHGAAPEGEFSTDRCEFVSGRSDSTQAAAVPLDAASARDEKGGLAGRANDAPAMALARRVAQAGVRLLLVRGSADPAFRACCAEQAVLCLHGVDTASLRRICRAARVPPLRDARQLVGLPRAQTVQLQGRLVQRGVAPLVDVPVILPHRQQPSLSPADSIEDCYLHLCVADGPGVCGKTGQEGASGRVIDAGGHASTDAWQGGAIDSQQASVVVFACGRTVDLARDVEAHFWNCIRRLGAALTHSRVVPGGGASEIACAASLELEAETACTSAADCPLLGAQACQVPRVGSAGQRSAPPTATLTSLQADVDALLRREVMLLVSGSLQRLVGVVLQNAGISTVAADARILSSMRKWRAKTSTTAEPPCVRGDAPALWCDPAFCPLIGIGVDAGPAGERGALDELSSKVAVLQASADVLHQVMVSDVLGANLGVASGHGRMRRQAV